MAPFNHQTGKRYGGSHLEPVHQPVAWRRILRSLELEPADLLAIPLCLVMGFGFAVYSMGVSGLLDAVQGTPVASSDAGTASGIVALLSVPAAAMRQLFS
jgi:hypothetical protein